MFEINWDIFKVKFNGKEQRTFESLSYQLFCVEFCIDIGIFRYKNQTGIEAEPIVHEGKTVGFQAKFYETKISTNVKDIQDSIAKAKNKNPNLNKILFYINQEFSESPTKGQKEPQCKTNIEKYAANKGLEIEWRMPSHFERQLALESNIYLAKQFFASEKSTFDLMQSLIQHTESILTPIRSEIEFKDNNIIKLDRSATLVNLKNLLTQSSIVILSGKGGVGKTAVIKDFYSQIKETSILIMFKATELNYPNINTLFSAYGNFTLSDFMAEYQGLEEKHIVIDSAEKLSDIKDLSAFQEFLSALLYNKWKIIFTTRHSYLDDLKFQLIDIHRLSFTILNIEEIKEEELNALSGKYCFNLPQNNRLFELLQKPFYLAEYLSECKNIGSSANLYGFKNLLWDKHILKSAYQNNNIHIKRETCFLRMVCKRVNEGKFFINTEDYDSEALHSLEADEIIKYDGNAGGYFITHDIYEEWALDKIIERSYVASVDNDNFFASIGNSLPIRRAFRNWLSERLFVNQKDIKSLIKHSLVNDKIESFWKDEMIVSVLLSEYAEVFFQLFEIILLENEQELLMRVVFLLRIACKEVDDDFLNQIGLGKINSILTTLFTQPKGCGWSYTINFIHTHKERLGTKHILTIIPMLADWNNKNIQSDTTKKASQIGLFYYENIVNNDRFDYGSKREIKEQLIRVILQGSAEIKEELKNIFDGIFARNNPTHLDRDYELVKVILTSLAGNVEVIKNFPDCVIKLAELFWVSRLGKNEWESYDSLEVEKYFGLSNEHDFNYFPASALQTPIYQLLRFAQKITIDFILSFMNRAVECYINSGLKKEVEEVKVVLDNKHQINQYISDRLWSAYRGSQVSTYLLESVHMALEKWLLDCAKLGTAEQLVDLCHYLIKNSHSASITAVVASVVMAYPSKLFDIAKILFQTQKFFYYDTNRMVLEEKDTYPIGYGLNYELHSYDRIKTIEDPHRKKRLEDLAVEYQFFSSNGVSTEESKKKQKAIWEIFDEYYKELEGKPEETESEYTWKLCLARMDRRKMNPQVEKKEGELIIYLNPQIEPELKKYSEDSLQKINDLNKYMPLYSWARNRYGKKKDNYCQYQQYENAPCLVVKEVKEIIQNLEERATEDFLLLNHSIPAYACSVLIRDFGSILNLEEMEFCKEIILDYSTSPLQMKHYMYQISDGIEPAISALPYLYKYFYNDVEITKKIKRLLILLLLGVHNEISTFATQAILQNLWELSFEDAHAIFLFYLNFKPKYNSLIYEIRKENHSYVIDENEITKLFTEKHKAELERAVSNKIKYDNTLNLQSLDLQILINAFELLPLGTKHPDHIKFVLEIFPILAHSVFGRDSHNNRKFNYELNIRFLDKLAAFVLAADKKKVETYIHPFVENFKVTGEAYKFFEHFIFVEDKLNKHEEFWQVWYTFYEKIKVICTANNCYGTKEVIYNYLLALPYWNKTATEWHSLRERDTVFYQKVSEDMGHFPPVLYSISKVLNGIGSNFLEDGILWLNNMIDKIGKNKDLLSEELETIFYIENIIRKYILTNRQKIRTTLQTKNAVLNILSFLVERGSTTGYLLRENVL